MPPDSRAFVDTNVLLYAYDASETLKQPIARTTLERLWDDRRGSLSTQVLQEFYVVATRKLVHPLARQEAREIVGLYSAWPVVGIDPAMILAATRLEEDERLSFWDALILEAARLSGADRVLTEDLQHGRIVGGVRIENPFAALGTRPPGAQRPASGRGGLQDRQIAISARQFGGKRP